MKKVFKILSLVLVLTLVLAPVVSLAATAADPLQYSFTFDTTTQGKLTGANKIINAIITVLQIAGYAIALVLVVWFGIQWMLAQPAKKAELKQKMWSMAIGIFLLVGGVSVLKIVWSTIATNAANIK